MEKGMDNDDAFRLRECEDHNLDWRIACRDSGGHIKRTYP